MRSARGDDFMFVSPVSASDDRMIDLQNASKRVKSL